MSAHCGAMEDAWAVLSIETDHPRANFRLAWGLSGIGRSSEAKRLAQKLLKKVRGGRPR